MTNEQCRLLSCLEKIDGWVTLYELSDTAKLVLDDDLFVPSLVARGWADHDPDGVAVRITGAGREALASDLELRSR
ncbi:hypothetical protein FF100_35895 [Methylobacterium terricola]|uniref:Uncharacterized protein n=1 Tax=Methylobacterium terricola TaxID=2583531 RepID=A0A5C4L4S5_9HYPH|nr:hypothetical protein FF100_35895 [Methylobacterium terricola]